MDSTGLDWAVVYLSSLLLRTLNSILISQNLQGGLLLSEMGLDSLFSLTSDYKVHDIIGQTKASHENQKRIEKEGKTR